MQAANSSLYATYCCYEEIRQLMRGYDRFSPFRGIEMQSIHWANTVEPIINHWTREARPSTALKAVETLCVVESTHRFDLITADENRRYIIEKGANMLLREEKYYKKGSYEVTHMLATQLVNFENRSCGFGLMVEEGVLLEQHRFSSYDYWRNRLNIEGTMELAKVATMFFSLVPTEAAVERSFSNMKFIHNDLRNHLNNDSVICELRIRFNCDENRQFLAQNIRFFEIEELSDDEY